VLESDFAAKRMACTHLFCGTVSHSAIMAATSSPRPPNPGTATVAAWVPALTVAEENVGKIRMVGMSLR
jgi:hypothetical protein